MGRQKNTPKKSADSGERSLDPWSLSDSGFVPVIRKRKFKRRNNGSYININVPTENKQFYLGELLIGNTNNVFPDDYNKCKIAFSASTEEELESIVIECDESPIVLVRLNIESDFLKELFKTKIFSLKFRAENENVFIDIYFETLPLPKFYVKMGNCIKTVFKLLYNIETATANEISSSKCDKNLHGNMEILELYKKISHARHAKLPAFKDVQHHCLKPKLRPYQEDAVRWMLYRERGDNEIEQPHPLYTTVTLKSGISIYYDKYTGYVSPIKQTVEYSNRGGILADEMGLGKTVEVLACILLNRKPEDRDMVVINDNKCLDIGEPNGSPVVDRQSKKRKIPIEDEYKNDNIDESKKLKVPDDWVKNTSKRSATKVALEMWYNSILSEMSTTQPPREEYEPMVQCICGSTSEEGIIECDSCGKYQHRSCLGYNKSFGRYLCPQCWMDEPLIECGGTLIVTPLTLRKQWCNEICKHIKGGLKVLQYEGYSATPVYPIQLKDYDLIITTYNVLKNELRLTESGQVLNLRRERKYSPPGSPLVRMKWWRLCLDEAQTVETPGRMVSEMAKKIDANYRWAVTGTPISKNILDLYGLIDYLQITPYNDYTTWKNILFDPYINGNEMPMINFLSDVLWRTAKVDVLKQIDIPNQTYQKHLLEFSAVEKFLYKREHELTCSDFLYRVRNYDLSMLLGKMDKKYLKNILAPLLTLRHACTHPTTLRGRYLATKKQVTSMKDLLDALIEKNTSDSEECLRLVIASLNGLAGIHLLLQSPQQAIHYYREVLQLVARFSRDNGETKLTVDNLQRVHTMYNLSEVLASCPPAQPTLRDDSLKSDCALLEQEYMEKFMNQTIMAYETSNMATLNVEKLQESFVLQEGEWYSDGLKWTFTNNYYKDLLDRVESASDRANIQCNLRSVSELHIFKVVYSWVEDISTLRLKLSNSIEKLYERQPDDQSRIIIKDNLVEKAMNCHLRPQKKSKTLVKCSVCLTNVYLKRYEGKLFNMTKRKEAFEEMSLVGSWKPTLEEIIFRSLLALMKAKNGNPIHIKDGEVHVNLLEALKKEFKEVRKLWTFLDQQVCAQDELDICKVRLQFKDQSSNNEENSTKISKAIKNLTYNLENRNDSVNLLSIHELDYQNSWLKNEVNINMAKLEKSLGTQSYLETLRKQQYEGQSPDPCPICKNALDQHWSILLCGHSYCLECIQVLLEKTVRENIKCSVCRNVQKYHEISYIKAGNTVRDEDCATIKGSYSTKIEAVIKLILNLKLAEPDVKVLVFSSWLTVLKKLRDALNNNDISCELGSANLEGRIENFKDMKKKITVFLLPIALGSKGLNLVEATHVVLVEPLLNPADELQAVGRVHRIGQKRETVVHQFLIKNTIEESIHHSTTSNAESWDKNKVTLQQLTNLFLDNDMVEDINEGKSSQDMSNSDSNSSQYTNEASTSTT